MKQRIPKQGISEHLSCGTRHKSRRCQPYGRSCNHHKQEYCTRFRNIIEARAINRLGQLLWEVAPWGGPILTSFYGVLDLLGLAGQLLDHLPAGVSLKPLNAAVIANEKTVSENAGWTINAPDSCHDRVRTFLDPMANVIRI